MPERGLLVCVQGERLTLCFQSNGASFIEFETNRKALRNLRTRVESRPNRSCLHLYSSREHELIVDLPSTEIACGYVKEINNARSVLATSGWWSSSKIAFVAGLLAGVVCVIGAAFTISTSTMNTSDLSEKTKQTQREISPTDVQSAELWVP